jgi:hypothetical protein
MQLQWDLQKDVHPPVPYRIPLTVFQRFRRRGDHARRLVEAFETAVSLGKGACMFEER